MTIAVHTRRARLAVAGSALALAMMTPGLAHAQAAADKPAAAADSSEIIVTAFKKSESSLKVPAVIAVLGGNELKTVGVNTVTDIQNLVPGLNIGAGAFGVNVSIRGVTSTDQTSKGELGIAFNIDGAFIGRGQEEGVAFFDLDRVEVLKGPQGTLYGRSSTGGAINVLTKKPEIGVFGGFANIEYGNYNTQRATAALNIPINDMLAIRIAGNFNDRDGYLTQTTTTVSGSPTVASGPTSVTLSGAGLPNKDDQHDRTGRFSLVFKPSSDVTFTSVNTVGHIGGIGQSTVPDDNIQAGGSTALTTIPDYVPAFTDDNFVIFNQALNWKLGGVQLDITGNEQHFSDHTQNTGNGNPFDTGSATAPAGFSLEDYQGVFTTNQFEARLSNTGPGFLDYVAGANLYSEHVRESDHNWNAPINADGTLSSTSDWATAIDPLNDTHHVAWGVFAQATAHVSNKFSIVAGARYTHDHDYRIGTFAVGLPASACTYPNDCTAASGATPNNGTETDSKVTWKVGLNYQITPRDLLYATVSTGFKAGGFNDFSPATGTTAPYGPESLTAYEIGYKGKPLPGLTFTADGYYYDYSKDQINGLTLFPTAHGVVGVLFTQLAPVEIYGLEGEARYQVDPATVLSASLAYEHSKIKSLESGFLGYLTGAFVNFAGQPLPNTPSFVANLVATHNFDVGNGAQVRLRAASKISSGYQLTDFANGVSFHQNAFTRSTGTITYATAGDRFTLQLFVENIENKVQRTAGPNGYNGGYGGFTGGNATPETAGTSYPLQSLNYGVSTPRFLGVRLGTKF